VANIGLKVILRNYSAVVEMKKTRRHGEIGEQKRAKTCIKFSFCKKVAQKVAKVLNKTNEFKKVYSLINEINLCDLFASVVSSYYTSF